MTRLAGLFPLLAAILVLGSAIPAAAAPVTVVDGKREVQRNDPLVPPRAESELPRPPAGVAVAGTAQKKKRARRDKGKAAVEKALRTGLRKRSISRAKYRRFRSAYYAARKTRGRLRGARRTQLAYQVSALERIALRRRLAATRMPALFLQLERNIQFWRSLPYPSSRRQIVFRGSEILFEYYPGRGLQIQPLATFKRANLMHGACNGSGSGPCRREGIRRLLDEMSTLAVRRGRGFVAWEYMFDFGGGAPPWMSGMAQATAVQALGRAAKLLDEPKYRTLAERALGAFDTPPPTGVRARGPAGGPHYLQYSFAPRLFIYNAFLQALIGLYDYKELTGNERADDMFQRAQPEGLAEIPRSDTGDWSRYSDRGRESTREYHELLREFLQSLCNRLRTGTYCTYAKRYKGYQTDPADLTLRGPETAVTRRATAISFDLSKLSAVEIVITKNGDEAYRKVATFRRGRRSFSWTPRSAGSYDVRLAAKELRTGRGLKTRDSGSVEVSGG